MTDTAKAYYEAYWSRSGYQPTDQTVKGKVLDLFARYVQPDHDALDVGCGDGKSATWLGQHAASYRGVDISASSVELVRSRGYDADVIADAAVLPFDDSSFDIVVCTEVLEHLMFPLDAAHEIKRVLRPGGHVVVTVPNIAYWRTRADLALLGRWNPLGDDRGVSEPWRDPHIRFFNVGTMRAFLRAANLTPVEVGGRAESPMLMAVPLGRRLVAGKDAGEATRRLAKRFPIFASHLFAVGRA